MASGTVPFQNPQSVDGRLDTEQLTVAGQSVHRERVQLSGDTETAIVKVHELTSSKALGVVLVDTAGVPYTVSSGGSSTPSSVVHRVLTGTVNAVNVKASAGTLRSIRGFNKADYPIYVKFHNTAGVPTAGVGVIETVGLQAGVTITHDLSNGMAYSAGIGITVVKDIADAGATPVSAEDGVIDVFYT